MSTSVQALIEEAAHGDIRAAARLMTLAENAPTRWPELYVGLNHWPSPRMVVGVTGPPGSGKSVLVDRMLEACRTRFPDRRVGVIAVDPSSPYTGGAFLGDRVRMMRHATDPMIFIRSVASRGQAGGLAACVQSMVRIMGLVGCSDVFVETLGVGQSEVDVASVADLVVLTLAPGQGDSIQLLKSGLLEAADFFVVNKSDQEGADLLYRQLLQTLQMRRSRGSSGKQPDVHLISAKQGQGVTDLLEGLERTCARDQEMWQMRRREAVLKEVRDLIVEEARNRLSRLLADDGVAERDVQLVLRGERTIASIAEELVDHLVAKERSRRIPV